MNGNVSNYKLGRIWKEMAKPSITLHKYNFYIMTFVLPLRTIIYVAVM